MKNIAKVVVGLAIVNALGGCAYAGVSTVGNDKVVVARNDAFLFGLLRKVFVCKVSEAGLTTCNSSEAP